MPKLKTTPRPDIAAKANELQAWVDGPLRAHLQALLDRAQRRTTKRLKFWQGMGTTFFSWDDDNEYRRPGDPCSLMDLLEDVVSSVPADGRATTGLARRQPELIEILVLVSELDDHFPNWIVGDLEPTVPPRPIRDKH